MSGGAGDLCELGARQLAENVASGQVSAAEVFAAFRDRARQFSRLNAFIDIADDSDMDSEATAKNNGKAASPLAGVPVAHKDIFCRRDSETTCGSRILSGYRPPFDAAVVERARQAAMQYLGRTNMDEFAMGLFRRAFRLRRDIKSVGRLARARRKFQRGGGGGGGATGAAGDRHRHRRLHSPARGVFAA